MYYFSANPETFGFYSPEVHGARTISVVDPAWTPIAIDSSGTVTDPDMIEIDNPETTTPGDAIEITDAVYSSLLAARSVGAAIEPDADGYPIAVFPPPLTPEEQLEMAKSKQVKIVTDKCRAAIIGGFTSDALGSEHTYPSLPEDQTNLIGAVASGLPVIKFWCADSAGVWAFIDHSSVQIKQVLADAGTQRMAFSAKLDGLVSQINSAATPDAVSAIVWS
jgi:hypothetical protein